MQLEPETAISRKGDTLVLGNRDTMHLSKSLAAIVGMHYDADHIYAVYQEMVVYWLNKREEFTEALPKADKRERANIRYRLNKIDDQIKRLRQHIKNVELVAEDFKRIFVKSGDDAPSEDREEAYQGMLDQFYEVSKLQTRMLEQYTHAYFVEGKGTIFIPALLVRTETPVKGESVEIGGLFYNVKTSSGATVSHYVPVKKTRKQENKKTRKQENKKNQIIMPIKNVISMPYRLAEPIKFRKMPSLLSPDCVLGITHYGHSAEYAALVEFEDLGLAKAKSADFLREVILETEESNDLFAEMQSISTLEAEYATKILEMRKSVRRRLSTLVIDLNTILEAKQNEQQ